MVSWNDFNRELQKRVDDPGVRYCLGVVYERVLDTAKQVDAMAEIINSMADAMNNLIAINEGMDGKLKALNQMIDGRAKGVEVESVPLTNEC